jgi:anti-sigma regulatory factor (Ser/Thr protein kinase)
LFEEVSGTFTINNDILAASLYAGIASTVLTQRGLINPKRKMQTQLALEEMLVNAIEHGNCGITYEEKTHGMAEYKSVVDIIAEKCKQPEIREKKVEFSWDISVDKTTFTIRDEGNGFDVKKALNLVANQDMLSSHGRGILLSSKIFSTIRYNSKGNCVALTLKHDKNIERGIPEGFEKGKTIFVKAGDVVMVEQTEEDNLYYIISGLYKVTVDTMIVGHLSPKDIFMGEMAFLLGKKRTATVTAETDGKLICLSWRTMMGVVKQYPQYGLFISKLIAQRLQRSNSITGCEDGDGGKAVEAVKAKKTNQ